MTRSRISDLMIAFGAAIAAAPVADVVAQPCTPSWSRLPSELSYGVHDMAVHDDGTGTALYVGGDFIFAGEVRANGIARWNGREWSALGSGMDNTVFCVEVLDDGTGPALYVGGNFLSAGGSPVNRIAKWDGEAWSGLGAGLNSSVLAITVYDDGRGGGPDIYATGAMDNSGGTELYHVGRWDGQTWSPLGLGLNWYANDLRVFDDGTGPALYAGGQFTTAGGDTAIRIAKWNGLTWSPVGIGANDAVMTLEVFDFGSGPALYAGGDFTFMGGVAGTDSIAKWNGQVWSSFGAGITPAIIYALAKFDDGTGPALYAAGSFTMLNGAPGERIAKWTGQAWAPLGAGVNPWVNDLEVFDDGTGPALYAAGALTSAGGAPANYIARWGCPRVPRCGSADFNCDGDAGTDADIEAFFACLAGDCPPTTCVNSADFNGDGDTGTDADIEAFFRVLAGGTC